MSLDPRTERHLAWAMRAGDTSAREALIAALRPAVVLAALRLGRVGGDLDDAVHDGLLGAIEAVDRFDPARGARLGTYAWAWIDGAIRGPRRVRPTPKFAVVQDEAPHSSIVDDLLGVLDHEELAIVTRRFGLGPAMQPARSRAEVAVSLGWTVARVREIEERAMSRMRVALGKVGDRAPQVGADPP